MCYSTGYLAYLFGMSIIYIKKMIICSIPQSHFFAKLLPADFKSMAKKCITTWLNIRSQASNEARGTKRVTKHCQGINISIRLLIRTFQCQKFYAYKVWRNVSIPSRLNPEWTLGQMICIINFNYQPL